MRGFAKLSKAMMQSGKPNLSTAVTSLFNKALLLAGSGVVQWCVCRHPAVRGLRHGRRGLFPGGRHQGWKAAGADVHLHGAVRHRHGRAGHVGVSGQQQQETAAGSRRSLHPVQTGSSCVDASVTYSTNTACAQSLCDPQLVSAHTCSVLALCTLPL